MKLRASKFRIAGMLLLLGLAGSIVVPRWISVGSVDGVLNGRMIVLRAPADGRLQGRMPAVGDPVGKSDTIASMLLQEQPQDRRDAARAAVEAAEATARLTALRAQLEQNEGAAVGLLARADKFQSGAIGVANQKRAAAEARLAEADAALVFLSGKAKKVGAMRKVGAVSQVEADEAAAVAKGAVERKVAAAAELSEAKIEATAAAERINLKDSQNETPYSAQRAHQLETERAAINTEIAGLEAKVAEMKASSADISSLWLITSPADAVVWRRLVALGSDVVKGQAVTQLVDCNDLFVDAEVEEGDAASIGVGSMVDVRIAGRPGSVQGEVRIKRGAGADLGDGDSAAGVSGPGGAKMVSLEIRIDPAEVRIGDDSFCNVGASARIAVPRKFDLILPF
jgi:multidrug resistance efflux pump